MASPQYQGAVFTPDPPVSGQLFSLRILATDPDVGVSLSYDVTVKDQSGNVATGKAVALSDKVTYEVPVPNAGSPPLTRDANDPSLFWGTAP